MTSAQDLLFARPTGPGPSSEQQRRAELVDQQFPDWQINAQLAFEAVKADWRTTGFLDNWLGRDVADIQLSTSRPWALGIEDAIIISFLAPSRSAAQRFAVELAARLDRSATSYTDRSPYTYRLDQRKSSSG